MWESIKEESLEGVLFLLPGFIALSIIYRLTEEDRGTIFTQLYRPPSSLLPAKEFGN